MAELVDLITLDYTGVPNKVATECKFLLNNQW